MSNLASRPTEGGASEAEAAAAAVGELKETLTVQVQCYCALQWVGDVAVARLAGKHRQQMALV